jgi:hypothetical protein
MRSIKRCTMFQHVLLCCISSNCVCMQAFVEGMKATRVGDPTDAATQMGPLAKHRFRDELHRQARCTPCPPYCRDAAHITMQQPTTRRSRVEALGVAGAVID